MRRASILLASISTGAAGVIHLAVVREHTAEALWLGVGFAVVGLVQLVLSISILTNGSRDVALVICSFQFLVISGWGISRTVGLPLVDGWTRELPGLADIAATLLEAASILFGLRLLALRDRRLVKRSAMAGAIALFLLSGSSAAARSISGQSPLAPAHTHTGVHEPSRQDDATSSNRSATTSHDHR